MDTPLLRELKNASTESRPITAAAALDLLHLESGDFAALFACTSVMTSARFGNRVSLCAIVNAKSGACSEDCAFCAQSLSATVKSRIYPFMDSDRILAAYDHAQLNKAKYFSLVTSGKALPQQDLEAACDAARAVHSGPYWCASMGCLNERQLQQLRTAGFRRYHHNLETAPSHYPQICRTHSIEERIDTLRKARTAGLELCSGGIFGLGENKEQRVELAMVLGAEQVDSIPINFLQPIKGTRLEKQKPLSPKDILLAIAMLRMTNPQAELRIAAGRTILGRLQSLLFMAGCSGMMIGDLLTTSGEDVAADHAMLGALEMEPETTNAAGNSKEKV